MMEEEEEGEEFDEEEFDEVEEVDSLDAEAEAEAEALQEEAMEYDEHDEEEGEPMHADDVPVDLDPRARLAPPLPPRSQWELSPPPPPTQRAIPIDKLRPAFRFYALAADEPPSQAGEEQDPLQQPRAASPLSPHHPSHSAPNLLPLRVLLKTDSSGSLRMLLSQVDELNARHAVMQPPLPPIEVSHAAVGALCKKDLVTAEAEGCWIYGFRIPRPNKATLSHAKSRHVALLSFRHHQHLLDHLAQSAAMAPELDEQGRAKLPGVQAPRRRSHPTVQ